MSLICECAKCGRKFSGISTFDLHRQPGKTAHVGNWLGDCRDPETKGMRLNAYNVWTLPAKASLAGLTARPRSAA